MRTDSWKGLVTQASPFVLPGGAAVEQVNIGTRIPGQITSRGGMRAVTTTPAAAGILDCFPYEYDGKVVLVALTATGGLVAVESPAYGTPPASAVEPTLAIQQGQVATAYTQEYKIDP